MRKFALLAVLGLAACAQTPEQIAAAQHAQCVELGYSEGSDAYGQCRLTLMAIEQQRQDAEKARWAQAAASPNLGLMMLQASRPVPGSVGSPMYTRPCRQGNLVYC